jgi:hypothetical protein
MQTILRPEEPTDLHCNGMQRNHICVPLKPEDGTTAIKADGFPPRHLQFFEGSSHRSSKLQMGWTAPSIASCVTCVVPIDGVISALASGLSP